MEPHQNHQIEQTTKQRYLKYQSNTPPYGISLKTHINRTIRTADDFINFIHDLFLFNKVI